MRGKIIVTGDKEIDRKLRQLEAKLAKKVIRQALRPALKPTLALARELAPVGETGDTKKAIKIRAGLRSRGRIKIVVMIGAGDFKGKTFYGSFPEFGTSRQKAQRFMIRAFEQTKVAVKADAERRILAGAEQAIKGG